MPAHTQKSSPFDYTGTQLQILAGHGNESADPAITLAVDATLRGMMIRYPLQSFDKEPVPYPFTVFMSADNSAVTDVELLNSFNGINATLAGRHYIARVQGQPLNIGVFGANLAHAV